MEELGEILKREANAQKAKDLQRFFKTGKGEYGEGDVFLGITVPQIRKLCKQSRDCELEDIDALIESPIHEARLLGLFLMIEKINLARKNRNFEMEERIFNSYLDYASQNRINNWDLVDLSAPKISGEFLISRDRGILYTLARSQNLWDRRIAILSTFAFIKNKDFSDSLKIAEILLKDKHDLIHKAVGWMLREIGKRNKKVLVGFLNKHYKNMPRTMLRYSIEKFEEGERKKYMRK